jgi:hypothetical protein
VTWHADPADYSKNYNTPAGFRASTSYALDTSDRYVWVYSAAMHWLDGTPPKAYIEALRLAKSGPGPGEPNPVQPTPVIPKAADQSGYSDAETFADLGKTMTEVFDFPKDHWKFKRDESQSGAKRGWFLPDFDDSGWRELSIGRFWEEQGEIYDGKAWYRTRFETPSIVAGKQVFLAIGAADESARVWLNGKFIGEHNIGWTGWDKPFAMDITHSLRSGGQNVLAVEVYDRASVGGLWRSVKLMEK